MNDILSPDQRLALLRKFPNFSGKEGPIPFTYRLFARQGCQQTVERYNLDRQFSGLEDANLILALLDWVSSRFWQDGAAAPRLPFTVDSLTDHCRSHQNSVNCQGLSLILAGLLRAYGVKAKVVYCFPSEQPFSDCHVVVHAYSSRLNQWILLDPSYRAVLFDESDNFLDLPGLRQAYIQGRAGKLATWDKFYHPNPAENFEFWLDYMAKNTFRFCCMVSNGPDFEADWPTRIELVPDGYVGSDAPSVTRDARAFWALP